MTVDKNFKTDLVKRLFEKSNKKNFYDSEISSLPKEPGAINFDDIIEDYIGEPLIDIIADIKNNGIKISVGPKTIEYISYAGKGDLWYQTLKKISIDEGRKVAIDISGVDELSASDFDGIRNVCDVEKVYINDGYDEEAIKGNSAEEYEEIVRKAELMYRRNQSQ